MPSHPLVCHFVIRICHVIIYTFCYYSVTCYWEASVFFSPNKTLSFCVDVDALTRIHVCTVILKSRMSIVLSSDTSNLDRSVQLPHKKIKWLNCRLLWWSSTQEYKISVIIYLFVLRTFFELSFEIFYVIFVWEVQEIIHVYLWYTRWKIWKSYSCRSCIFLFFFSIFFELSLRSCMR